LTKLFLIIAQVKSIGNICWQHWHHHIMSVCPSVCL